MDDTFPVLSITIFRKQVYSKNVIPAENKNRLKIRYLQSVDYCDAYLKIHFSAGDPFYTGIATGAAPLLPMLLKNIAVTEYPDFLADKGYFLFGQGQK